MTERQLAQVTAERDAKDAALTSCYAKLEAALAERDALRVDAERFNELIGVYMGADFSYGETNKKTVLLFAWDGCEVMADLRKTIDAARGAKHNVERNGSRSESDCRAKLGDLESKHG